eukprot:TRINITY_DN18819_c0_g1_i3.p1 TRINITY_DN18819_c0_g1~~TRINITY_DN18819_c0_g1_i3.p1  ORF type:complete len:862 (-),score=242.99 TRINITY_DN18819_c0_g1_i3:43-2628(-)
MSEDPPLGIPQLERPPSLSISVGSSRHSDAAAGGGGQDTTDAEWVQLIDKKTGKTYYYNRITRQSRWTQPPPASPVPTRNSHHLRGGSHPDSESEADSPSPMNHSGGAVKPDPRVDAAWVRKVDQAGEKFFYYNRMTKASTWERPDCFDEISENPLDDDSNISDQAVEDNLFGQLELEGWRVRHDRKTGKKYYFNRKTKEACWHAPPAKRRSVMDNSHQAPGVHVNTTVLMNPSPRRGSRSVSKRSGMGANMFLGLEEAKEEFMKRNKSFADDSYMLSENDEQEDDKENAVHDANAAANAGPVSEAEAAIEEDGLEFDEKYEEVAATPGSKDLLSGTHLLSSDAKQPEEIARVKRVKLELAKHRKGWVKRTFHIGAAHEEKVLLSFKKSLIKKAIMKRNRSHDKECVQFFKNVLSYMGDRKSSKSDVQHCRKIVRNALDYNNEGLKDEVYLQICKQVTNHYNLNHAIKGWELMTILLACFAPSQQMRMWLEDFIQGIRDDEFTDVAIKDLTDICLARLELICAQGDRKEVPSTKEILIDQTGEKYVLAIYTPDGSTLSADVDAFTPVRQVRLALLQSLGVFAENMDYFSIIECSRTGQEMIADDNERILDVIASWTRKLCKTPNQPESAVADDEHFRLFLKAGQILEFQQFFSDDESAINLAYLQAVSDVVTEKTPALVKDCINLAALQLQNSFGDYNPDEHTEDWMVSVLGDLVPRSALFDKKRILRKNAAVQEAAKKVLEKYVKLKGRGAPECRRQYLETVEKWPLYGTTIFAVEQSTTHSLPPMLKLGVSRQGILMLNPKTYEIFEIVPFSDIVSIGGGEQSFAYVRREGKEETVTFRSKQASTIRDTAERYRKALTK